VLDHGIEKARTFLAFRSAADGTWTMNEKLVALSDVTTAEVAAKGYDRGRMTDKLCLNSIRGERQWGAGEVISEYAVTMKCVETERP